MPLLPSLPENATVGDVRALDPELARPLAEYHERLLRGPSPFTVAERELIAAYVSGLNACPYCHGVHTAVAETFGVRPGLLESLVEDVETAEIDARLRPVLRYVAKLTQTPSRMVQADAEAVLAAGWSELALFHAVAICGLFNLMNRVVFGCGIELNEATLAPSVKRLSEEGYLYATPEP